MSRAAAPPWPSSLRRDTLAGMNKMARWAVLGLIGFFLVIGAGLCDQKKPADRIPREVRQAEQTISKWVNGFKGQTEQQVRQALGPPAQALTWEFKGKDEPYLKFKVGEKAELWLYFYDGKVVTPSMHFLF